jgi:hypothetical protein
MGDLTIEKLNPLGKNGNYSFQVIHQGVTIAVGFTNLTSWEYFKNHRDSNSMKMVPSKTFDYDQRRSKLYWFDGTIEQIFFGLTIESFNVKEWITNIWESFKRNEYIEDDGYNVLDQKFLNDFKKAKTFYDCDQIFLRILESKHVQEILQNHQKLNS